jgi:hypothetical protein
MLHNTCCNKNCKKHIFLNEYCLNHFKLNYIKYIITIQKYYKGFKCRKKLNNIYKKLPDELQRIILFYIKEPVLYKNYCTTLNRIIRKKTTDVLNIRYNHDHKPNILYYIKTYEYFNKYRTIMYINDLKFLYIISYELLTIINDIIYLSMEYDNYFNNTNLNIQDTVINNHLIYIQCGYSDILYFKNLLLEYRNMYNNFYNINKHSVFM